MLGGAGAAMIVAAETFAAASSNAQGASKSVDITATPGKAEALIRPQQPKVNHKNDPIAWARRLLAASDAGDRDIIFSSLAPNARFRFGNAAPVFGIDAISKETGRVVGEAKKRHHEIQGVWTGKEGDLDVVSIEADVTYTFQNDAAVTVPVTSTIRIRDDDLIADYRIFIDLAPFRDAVERMAVRR